MTQLPKESPSHLLVYLDYLPARMHSSYLAAVRRIDAGDLSLGLNPQQQQKLNEYVKLRRTE